MGYRVTSKVAARTMDGETSLVEAPLQCRIIGPKDVCAMCVELSGPKMSVRMSVHVSAHMSEHISTHMPVHPCVHMSAHMSTHIPTQMSTHMSEHTSAHMSEHTSARMSVHMSTHTSTHTHRVGRSHPMRYTARSMPMSAEAARGREAQSSSTSSPAQNQISSPSFGA